MLEYLAKSEWNRTFDRESFVKAIKPSLNKLKLDATFAEELSDIVQQQVAAGKFSENLVITKYRDLIKWLSMGLEKLTIAFLLLKSQSLAIF